MNPLPWMRGIVDYGNRLIPAFSGQTFRKKGNGIALYHR